MNAWMWSGAGGLIGALLVLVLDRYELRKLWAEGYALGRDHGRVEQQVHGKQMKAMFREALKECRK